MRSLMEAIIKKIRSPSKFCLRFQFIMVWPCAKIMENTKRAHHLSEMDLLLVCENDVGIF